MNCPYCQIENSKTSKFCHECGARLLMFCDFCGYENHPDEKICGDCGRVLEKGFKKRDVSSRIESERKNVTVLFTDISGYTQLSEMLDPEEVKEITHKIFNGITGIIAKYEGFIERVFGDEVLAYFGVPRSYEDHPLSALLAAVEIHDHVKAMSLEFKEKTGQTLRMHTGVNTGLVVTGNTDINKGQDGFSGQTINIASRLVDLAGADEILIGSNTFHKTAKHIISEAVSPVGRDLKNFEGSIYRVIGLSNCSGFAGNLETKLTSFVGREHELGLLLDFFEQSQTGRPLWVSIVSNSGEGKSRLLYEFRKTLTTLNADYFEGKCFSFHLNTAYSPIINLLKDNFNIQESDDDFAIKRKVEKSLARLGLSDSNHTPYILQLLSVKDSIKNKYPLNFEELKDRIVLVTRQMLISGSKIKPIIIAVEDLHWIDKSSENFLQEMLKDLPATKVLFIFTYRTEYSPPWKGMPQTYEINLKPLNNRDTRIMVQNLLGTKRLESDLEKLLLEKTRGVPFFIEEFTKSLIDKQEIKRKGDSSHLVKDLKNLEIPSTIQDLISARIDSLPKGAKELLQKGSVAGRAFNYEIIMRLTGFSEEKLLMYLSLLRDAQFLHLNTTSQNEQYQFKHSITQEVAYSGMLISKRKKIHDHVATVIETLYAYKIDQFFEILAHHYSTSGNTGKAYQYLILAGKKATLNYSHQEAFHFFKSAAEVAGKGVERREGKEKKIEAFKLSLVPMVRLGYPPDSLKILNEGMYLSKEINDEKSLATFYDLIGNYYTAKGRDPFLGIEYSEKCLTISEKIKDFGLLARVSRGLCGAYIVVGEPRKSANLAGKVIDILEQQERKPDFPTRELSVLPVLKALLAHSHGWLGDFVEAEKWAEKTLSLRQNPENYHDLAYIHFLCGYLYVHSGEGKKSIEHFNKCIRYSEEGKVVLWIGLGWTGLGMGYFFLGDLKSAKKWISKGIKFQKELNIPYYLSFHLLALGLVSYSSKELSRAEYFLENALKLSVKYGEKWVEGVSKTFLGNILIQLKKTGTTVEEAEAFIREGIEILNEREILPWSTIGHFLLGQSYALNGNIKKTTEALKKAEGLFNEMNMKYWLNLTRKALLVI